ncbi:hypothetical protein [Psychroflexus aestuariivivens]|uniref:hypothetical protein n=1 Tax=Psychroflexus aestuariivivens TaxID=1795040 RepID=UPI000FD9F860|nr:hypothetical protein [Psychroflexus aestuariivivens]
MKKQLIVESEFLDNLFLTQETNDVRSDLYHFITQDFSDYHLICDFEGEIDFQVAMEENPIWEIMLDKFNTIEYQSSLKIDKICRDTNKFSHSLFFLDRDSSTTNNFTEKYGFIFLNNKDIEKRWAKFAETRKGVHFKVTKSKLIPDDQKLDCWSKLDKYCSPLNSLIIFDKYILNDSSNQKMSKNLLPFLKMLLSNKKTIQPIDITIITELKRNCNIKERHSVIERYLKNCGINSFNLNIAIHYKGFYPKSLEGIHSRFILTNYFHFKCDASFNFFKNNGSINNDADMRINFILSENNEFFFKKELHDIKQYLDKIKNDSHPSPEYKIMYYPDKQNSLLV